MHAHGKQARLQSFPKRSTNYFNVAAGQVINVPYSDETELIESRSVCDMIIVAIYMLSFTPMHVH